METWLTPHFSDSFLNLHNFTLHRCDRLPLTFQPTTTDSDPKGGAVLIALKNCIPNKKINNPDDTLEQVWTLILLGRFQLVFGCVYIPPKSNLDVYDRLGSSVNKIRSQFPSADIYIFGDFNLPKTNWVNSLLGVNISFCRDATALVKSSTTCLANYINFNNLHQHNVTLNKNNVLLDLIFSNVLSPIDNHHPPLQCNIIIPSPPVSSPLHYKRNFKLADYKSIAYFLNTFEWDHLLDNDDTNVVIDIFYDIIYACIDCDRNVTCSQLRTTADFRSCRGDPRCSVKFALLLVPGPLVSGHDDVPIHGRHLSLFLSPGRWEKGGL